MKIYLAIGALDKMRIDTFTQCGVERVLVSFLSTGGGKQNIKIPFSDVMIDSGAYGVETGTGGVNVKGYSLWLEIYLNSYPQIKTYVNLDILGSPVESMKNQEYMESLGLKPMPVYHYGEPPEFLDKMCSKYKYVGLGGLAVGKMPSQNLKTFWEWVAERHPENDFHIFGAMSMNAISKYQPYSIDSSSWAVGTKYRRLAGYRDGLPAWFSIPGDKDGWQIFLTSYELWANNIRAMLDWEKLEWLKNVNKHQGVNQQRLF